MIDHFGINCADLDAAKRFYDQTLAVLGHQRFMDYGAFVRDPDGNNVEAVCHSVSEGD